MVTNKNINISIIQHPYTTWSTLLANLENIKCKKGLSISNEKFWSLVQTCSFYVPLWPEGRPYHPMPVAARGINEARMLLSSFSLGPWKNKIKQKLKTKTKTTLRKEPKPASH